MSIVTKFSSNTYFEGDLLSNILSLSVEKPSNSLIVSFSATYTSNLGVVQDISTSFFPLSTNIFSAAVNNQQFSLNILSGPGKYSLGVTLNGVSKSEYKVFVQGSLVFHVYNRTTEPPLPQPYLSQFSLLGNQYLFYFLHLQI